MEYERCFIVDEDDDNLRIDKYLSEYEAEHSRTYIQKLIADGRVTVNNKTVKGSYRLSSGECIRFFVPEPQKIDILPENIPLDIIYEDNDIIIINKEKGMVIHPAAGHSSGTLVNALMYHCSENLSGINGILRPGIVHRIDKDTTGVMIACKNDKAHIKIAEQLKQHSNKRIYNAIVHGIFKEENGRINEPIGRSSYDRKKMDINYKNGKEAITEYHVLQELQGRYTHIECQLHTGRTHQIRVHMTSIGHPLLGDSVYSGYDDTRFNTEGQVLHASVLGIIHPVTNEYMEFNAPLPEYFNNLLLKLR